MVCKQVNPKTLRKCAACFKDRPKVKQPAHKKILRDMPYEAWVEKYGDRCQICGAEGKTRRLHRDHDHLTGKPRGILCFRDNAILKSWVTSDWLRRAADYLDRAAAEE